MADSSKSSPSDRKRPRSEKDCPGEAKRRRDNEDGGRATHVSPPSPVAGPSRDVNTAPPAPATPQEDQLGRLTALLSGVMEKLDRATVPTTSGASVQHDASSGASFSGFSVAHTLSSSEEEGEIVCAPDPLDASVSKANALNVPLSTILAKAGWTQETTFARHYNKEISLSSDTFQRAVLEIAELSLNIGFTC